MLYNTLCCTLCIASCPLISLSVSVSVSVSSKRYSVLFVAHRHIPSLLLLHISCCASCVVNQTVRHHFISFPHITSHDMTPHHSASCGIMRHPHCLSIQLTSNSIPPSLFSPLSSYHLFFPLSSLLFSSLLCSPHLLFTEICFPQRDGLRLLCSPKYGSRRKSAHMQGEYVSHRMYRIVSYRVFRPSHAALQGSHYVDVTLGSYNS